MVKPSDTRHSSAENRRIIEELTCIVCPKGCRVTVTHDPETGVIETIEHADCTRGKAWVTREILDPVRMICSSVLVTGGVLPLVSVRTDRPVPRRVITAVMQEIRQAVTAAPVHSGEVIITNPAGTECNVIATRQVPSVI